MEEIRNNFIHDIIDEDLKENPDFAVEEIQSPLVSEKKKK